MQKEITAHDVSERAWNVNQQQGIQIGNRQAQRDPIPSQKPQQAKESAETNKDQECSQELSFMLRQHSPRNNIIHSSQPVARGLPIQMLAWFRK